jgi:hypothetical protein
MTFQDKLNFVGIIITGAGATLGMVGVFSQTNGYFAFRSTEIFDHLWRVFQTLRKEGKAKALEQIRATSKLAEARGENRVKSLIGLYLVLFGFFLQMIGSLILLGALFAPKEEVKAPPPAAPSTTETRSP